MLSVVIPVYNEADLVSQTVGEVGASLRAGGEDFEILVVENGSTDATLAVAEATTADVPELRVLHLDHPDYGAALRTGLLSASGEIVVNFDVDYYDLDFLQLAVAAIRGPEPGAPDLIVGSKRAPGSADTRAWYRRLVTWTFTFLLRAMFGMQVSDTHGVKAMRRAAVTPIAQRCKFGKDLFDTELVLRSERANLIVTEIPVAVVELRPSRTSIFRRVPRTVLGLVRLRISLWRNPV